MLSLLAFNGRRAVTFSDALEPSNFNVMLAKFQLGPTGAIVLNLALAHLEADMVHLMVKEGALLFLIHSRPVIAIQQDFGIWQTFHTVFLADLASNAQSALTMKRERIAGEFARIFISVSKGK